MTHTEPDRKLAETHRDAPREEPTLSEILRGEAERRMMSQAIPDDLDLDECARDSLVKSRIIRNANLYRESSPRRVEAVADSTPSAPDLTN